MLRLLQGMCGLLLVALASGVNASPKAQPVGETISIPFDPPLGESLSYRWEQIVQSAGATSVSAWVGTYRFEEDDKGHRLFIKPISYDSNEKDPKKLELAKKIEGLTKQPFVLRLNEDAQIVEMEHGEKYWTKIIKALREVLSARDAKLDAAQEKAVEAVVGMFEKMPVGARLAKLTESAQPLVEFAYAQASVRQPIKAALDTPSPFGGTIKQDVVVSLTKVHDGFAHLTVRSTVPRAELEKMAASMLDKLGNGGLRANDLAKARSALAGMKDFKSDTVADYKISLESGMLEAFSATQTIVTAAGDKVDKRVKTISLTRVN